MKKKFLLIISVFTIVMLLTTNSAIKSFSIHQMLIDAGKWARMTTGKIVNDNWCGFGSKDALVWAYINDGGNIEKLNVEELKWVNIHTIEENEDEMSRIFKVCKLSDPNLLKVIMDYSFGTGTYAHYCKRHKIKDVTTYDTSSFGNGVFQYKGKTNTLAPAANVPTSQDELLAQYQAALAKQQKATTTTTASSDGYIDGFDPTYYANNNPDVVKAVGNDAKLLYAHYVNCGKAEGRKAHG